MFSNNWDRREWKWCEEVKLDRGDVVYGIYAELSKYNSYWSLPTYCNVANDGMACFRLPKFKSYPSLDFSIGRYKDYMGRSNIARRCKSYLDQILMDTREGHVFFVIDGIKDLSLISFDKKAREKISKENNGYSVTYIELKHLIKLIILESDKKIRDRVVFIEKGETISFTDVMTRITHYDYYIHHVLKKHENIYKYTKRDRKNEK